MYPGYGFLATSKVCLSAQSKTLNPLQIVWNPFTEKHDKEEISITGGPINFSLLSKL